MLGVHMASADRNTPKPDRDTSGLRRRLFEILIVLWLALVNCFYYLQFKALIVARLTALKHR